MIKFIDNIGDYFSSNFFDEDFVTKVADKSGLSSDSLKEIGKRFSAVKEKYFRYKQNILEGGLRVKDKIYETHLFNGTLLEALDYDAKKTNYDTPYHLSEDEVLPVRHILYRGDQPYLFVLEMQPLIREGDKDPDGLFEQRYNVEQETVGNPPQKYHRSQWERVFRLREGLKISPVVINKAVSELLLIEQHQRPKYILLLAGNVVFLLEQEKWFRGSYLKFDLEELFDEATVDRRYYSLFYLLLSKEMLAPQSNMVLMDQLDEDSHKSAYEVTQDLKEGIIHAVEALANEALYYKKTVLKEDFDETDDDFEQQVKDDCLTIIYRMLFIFYAESREDLNILPINDPYYEKGYSLEMLRDLEQVPMHSESSRNGYFFHHSLTKLFNLLSSGYRENENDSNRSFKVRHIDSPLFNNKKLHYLGKVKFRNWVWQDIVCELSLSKQQNRKARGRISYANLGINQLGSVYESLLAYRGFFAEQDYIEVHKANKPEEGTYLVPRSRRDDFEDNEILKDKDGTVKVIPKGKFIYRLSGRDRQKSASYYTPEVLTQCTVKYTLKPILEKVEKGEMKATELLELKLLEPAMGAAAFHNDMINQLAEAYLNYRQEELKKANRKEWKIQPDRYKEELQKVKAYIATHNVYGVDLNPTAIELGKLSLWLNVIHKDMETPFFSNRLGVGNAVVGAWLKVYKEKDLNEEFEIVKDKKGKEKKHLVKKEWWEKAPTLINVQGGIKRKDNEIYHFLLPDKNMIASAEIGLLKQEYSKEVSRARDIKKEWLQPLTTTEVQRLKTICKKIDTLLKEYYEFQQKINALTSNKQDVWGIFDKVQQRNFALKNFEEKERLADERNRHNAPYFKLKIIMDYWCSLWFWDVRDAVHLPTRALFWKDIEGILAVNVEDKFKNFRIGQGKQQKLYESAVQTELALAEGDEELESEQVQEITSGIIIKDVKRKDLFDDNIRLKLVRKLAETQRYFHPQLEFLEVFWERNGFDLIAGNPPWVNISFDETGIISEKTPEIVIRTFSANEISLKAAELLINDDSLHETYLTENIEAECIKVFTGSIQNYDLLESQKTNLYKCIITTSYILVSPNGIIGLIHPEGLYDDPAASKARELIYKLLLFHFQFKNELSLFPEVHHETIFSINIYSGKAHSPHFISINNLFHPSTIDLCFIHDGKNVCGGIKIKDEVTGKMVWNITPHSNRVVYFDENTLSVLSNVFESSQKPLEAKLVSIHSKEIIDVFEKLGKSNFKVKNYKFFSTQGWNEVSAVKSAVIHKNSKIPNYDNYEQIISGPHFFVANPFYKYPKKYCKLNSDYDTIDLTDIDEDFFSKVNYTPKENGNTFYGLISEDLKDKWLNNFKVCFSRRLSITGERTLQPAVYLPKTTHINGVLSLTFQDSMKLVEFSCLSASIVYDFYIKATGRADLYDFTLTNLPLGINKVFLSKLLIRGLRLNCLNIHYQPLWEENWAESYREDQWSKMDPRLSNFDSLTRHWLPSFPLRNWYERRQALVEIDVITAIALHLTLKELILIYNVQFPVLQQNEDDTWYDQKGNIVFTCSKGLTGVGVDRPVWETIRHLKAGETYEHAITKSELYYGKKVTYYAPFDKCDRVEDYKTAWAHFEKVFAAEKE